MNNKLTPSKVTSTKTLKVVANFTNGFAQNVIELEDGTVLFINYGGTEVTVNQTTPFVDPTIEIPAIVNASCDHERTVPAHDPDMRRCLDCDQLVAKSELEDEE